jgi:ribose 1,5-bisphosphokinase PhnN
VAAGGIDGRPIRGAFSGTDGLSLGINPRAIAWLSEDWLCPYRLVIAEGDRLANPAFIDAVRQHWALQVIVLTGPAEAAQRRLSRGTTQNESWVKGRITKVQNLAAAYGDAFVDASGSVDDTVELLRSAMFSEWLEYAA